VSDNPDILLVGSNRTIGGIQRYIDQQTKHLSSKASVRVYDIEPSHGTGPVCLIMIILQTIFDALLFPFRRRPDIVHVHTAHWFSFYRATFYVLFSAYVWRVPVVLHVHGSSFDEFLTTNSIIANTIQAIGFRASSTVITLSDYWKELVETHTEADHIITIPNAVDPKQYTASSDSVDPTIVYVSHLSKRKGAAEFATAVSDLVDQRDDVTVHIAGSGSYADRIEQLESNYDEVHYHGYVSESKKNEIYSQKVRYSYSRATQRDFQLQFLKQWQLGMQSSPRPLGVFPKLSRKKGVESLNREILTRFLQSYSLCVTRGYRFQKWESKIKRQLIFSITGTGSVWNCSIYILNYYVQNLEPRKKYESQNNEQTDTRF